MHGLKMTVSHISIYVYMQIPIGVIGERCFALLTTGCVGEESDLANKIKEMKLIVDEQVMVFDRVRLEIYSMSQP